RKISLEGYVDFATLNKFCLDMAKIFNNELYRELEKVRKLRNKIHLKNLSEIDRKFSKKDVDKIAEIANKVLDVVKKRQK
ncbi:MAG: hypothetical protein IH949_09540, partial [Bacteroidetes bacterium]|nr:hypothetical protein [Bacteroidota bacterium]